MDQVEEVKGKVDMVELVSEYVPLKRAGRNFKGLCPWHGEKTPSFMVNPELRIYKCFGCNEGGDCYSFLQKIEGMEFGEALKKLAEQVGVKLTSYRPSRREEEREKIIKINTLAAQVYHWVLVKQKAGERARKYLQERGLSEEVIEKFRLGYAPDAWEYLKKFLVEKKGFGVDDLRRAGLVVEGRNYDRFRGRIMFPLANAQGQVVGFAGRVLPGAGDMAGGKYINTPETEIYHKSELLYGLEVTRGEIKKAGWVVVVEGEIDMLASWQAGVRNVVAIKGSALTEKQVEWLRRVCNTVVLALDADAAGDVAARRGIEIADRNGLMVKMVKLSEAKDPGEYAMVNPKGWKKAVEEAIPIYDFYIKSAVARQGLGAEGKKKIGMELLPIWAGIADEIVKGHYIKKLAEVLEVREEDVRTQLGRISNSKFLISKQGPNDRMSNETKRTRREVVEEYVTGLALRADRIDRLISLSVGQMIRTQFWRKVVEQAASRKPQTTKELIEDLPRELRSRVEELMLVDESWEEEAWGREWEKAVRELEEIEVRERIRAGGDIAKLTRRLAELTKGK